MPTLFSYRSGAKDWQVLEERYTREEWNHLRDLVRQILEKRSAVGALKLLDRFDWVVMDGTNGFQDDFGVLYAHVSLQEYTENAHLEGDPQARKASVDTSNPATDVHRKTGHHDDGLRLVIGLA